jgi:hypothetical protein
MIYICILFGIYLLIFALCKTSKRADERIENMNKNSTKK